MTDEKASGPQQGDQSPTLGPADYTSGNALAPGVALVPKHEALRAELADLKASVEQWDEEDGDLPPTAAFDDAEAFLGLLFKVHAQPSIYASGDAEAGFRWLFSQGFAEVAFRGDGRIRCAFRFWQNLDGDTAPFAAGQVNSLPEPLSTALTRL